MANNNNTQIICEYARCEQTNRFLIFYIELLNARIWHTVHLFYICMIVFDTFNIHSLAIIVSTSEKMILIVLQPRLSAKTNRFIYTEAAAEKKNLFVWYRDQLAGYLENSSRAYSTQNNYDIYVWNGIMELFEDKPNLWPTGFPFISAQTV